MHPPGKSLKRIPWRNPTFFATVYLIVIPIFALLYRFFPWISVDFGKHNKDIISCLYFSTTTISTLGFGDIAPLNKPAQIVAALEVLIGITLIGLFLNSISLSISNTLSLQEKKWDQKRQRDLEKIHLFNINHLVELNISFYLRYTAPITIPILNRHPGSDVINPNFLLSDMQDLFKPALYMSDNLFIPAVNLYYKHQQNLEKSIIDLIYNVDLKHWPDLLKICIEFLDICKKLDFSGFIINQPNVTIGGKKGSEADSEMLKSHTGPIEFKGGNAIDPYVGLCHQIRYILSFIDNYHSQLNLISSETP